MHIKFLGFFVDPVTQEKLVYEGPKPTNEIILEGFLVSSTNRYPIIRGISRFVPKENYAESFGWQWNHWSRVQFDSENIGKPMEGHTGRMWHTICGVADSDSQGLEGKLVLDIGCGPGRFVEVARNKGATVIGIDYSIAADAAAKNFANDPNVCIVQADALKLPFPRDTFDAAFSIGVLHHTPNPSGGVKEAFRVLRSSGWLAIAVYGKSGYYKYPNVQAWRWIFSALWPYFSYRPALIYTYVTVTLFSPISRLSRTLGRMVKIPFPFISLPDKNWSLLDTFDSVTPSYQSGHESYEVFSWFKETGFHEIEPTNWGATSWRGIKPVGKHDDAN